MISGLAEWIISHIAVYGSLWKSANKGLEQVDCKQRQPSSTWKDVVHHLETSREAYQKKGVAARNIEWAVQNARVVLQCMQMHANEATRDKSMADNVRWILDNNPGSKIVLWAHNGHVTTASAGGYHPMGASLREIFGVQMVVFGFAFNQGSFQAVELGKGLRNFTVPPSAGSLDATFADTKIPIIALDLRTVPKTGPVAEWFSRPHQTRSIGAVYSESSAAQYLLNLTAPECFDVVLFVEKTTAAQKQVADPNLEYGWLGIQLLSRDDRLVVDIVLPDGPAAKAGIKTGDVIRKVDVTTVIRFTDLVNYLQSKKPGQMIKLLIGRGDQEIETNVTLGKRPIEGDSPSKGQDGYIATPPPRSWSRREWGDPKPGKLDPIKVDGNLQESKLIKRVEPVYPELAKRARVEGRVLLVVTVDEEGSVSEIRVSAGHPLLVESTLNAVSQWKYSPTLLNGESVPVITTVTVRFSFAALVD